MVVVVACLSRGLYRLEGKQDYNYMYTVKLNLLALIPHDDVYCSVYTIGNLAHHLTVK